MGAIILLLSDTIARTVFQPVELSVGIVTGIIGAPFFLFLLHREGMKQ
jgi:iron complex transport system permease protein